MGRYRPPQPPSSPYITEHGYEVLQNEQSSLWRRRADVVNALSAAAAEGDRSENAEYIYRKKELREIDRRIRYLQKRLPELTVVRTVPADSHHIYFGAWVKLEDEEGNEQVHRIVGPDEFAADPRYISLDSPLAQALLKKAVDDEVEVMLPRGKAFYYIMAISYQSIEE